MFRLRLRPFVCKAVWYVLATLTFATGTASAFGQIATSTTATLAPTPVYYGQIPVATITVTASDGSTPTATGINSPYLERDVSCNIQARGHAAAYGANLQNGVASIPLTTLEFAPVGNQYALACSYNGSATYAPSSAATVPFSIINCAVWVVNGNGTVSQLDCLGNALGTQGTPGAPASAGGIAVDSTGNAWAVTNTSNSLVFVSPVVPDSGPGINTGATTTSTFTGGGLLQPSAVAIDGAGQVWIANGGNTVSSFSNNGAAQSPATGYGATTAAAPTPYNAPSSIAVDQAGSVWITNSGGNTVTRIFGSAAPVVVPLVTGVSNGTTGTKP
jgi:hypothetical protein